MAGANMLKRKNGFTFVEVLVIVVLIAIISLVAVPSYKKGLETSKNNQARAKLLEIANAARMYNEDARGSAQVAGSFGAPVEGYSDPRSLFFSSVVSAEEDMNESSTSKYAYLTDPESLSGTGFRGYNFYICTPDVEDATCGGDINVVAIMTPGESITDERYVGKMWKVSNENPGRVVMMSSAGA